MPKISFSRVTDEIEKLSELSKQASYIDPKLYNKFDVKRGLRDITGAGVVVGITNISEVNAFRSGPDGSRIPIDGELFYRGYNIKDLIRNQDMDNHFGFEECCYLLLFGQLPSRDALEEFTQILSRYRALPRNFVRDVIMKRPSSNMMNTLAKCVLALYSYDDNPEASDEANILRQCLELIAMFPLMSVYGYHAFQYYQKHKSLIIHRPVVKYSTAENILHCLRADSDFSPLEAKLLDVALILHMEHGGGNNSTFTTHLVSSSGTDTYSAIAAALGSLKGPRHGGANIKVVDMFADMKRQVKNWEDKDEIANYLRAILHKQAFDRSGLIYGIGHAVYSKSDPRAEIFRGFVEQLAHEKGYEREFALYRTVEKLAPEIIADECRMYKGVSPNVDFYSGFAYRMLDLPLHLYTPLFAIARIAGWSAHRMEEICSRNKIMRPAYVASTPHRVYVPMEERKDGEI
ncbi:MAG: citrate/2-methylcitrate synthase [Lachnospiraceae bacterium]|nr:citrate/2-methylcitrate synthase [Lachnospiraceae bacterium]